jgi:MFS family permease
MGTEPAAPTERETTHRAAVDGTMLLAMPRFRLFLAVTVAWFLSFFLLQAALPKYLERHHFSNGRIGLVIGILSVSAVLSRPFLGRAMDRGLLFPLLVASCLMMLSSPLYGVGAALSLLILVRLFQGISSGIFMTGGPVFVAELTPARRRGEAMGLFAVASTVAIAVGPPAGLILGEHVSYHLTWALSAGAGVLGALLLLPLRGTHGAPPVIRPRGALIEWRVWPAAIPGFIAALGNGTLFAFLVPLMDARHLPGAGFFFTFDACAFFLVRAVGGRWSDRFGRWAVVVPGLAALGLALTILAAIPSFPAFVVAALVWGGAISVIIPELTALAVDLVPPARRGAAVATYTGVFEAGIALSGLALGWVADVTSLPFIFALAAALLFLTATWAWGFSQRR